MFHESLLLILQGSSPPIMYYLHLYSNWKIVNGHLGKSADERDTSDSSKRYQNILVTKLTFFGDNLKSLSQNNIEEKKYSLLYYLRYS